ncbi:MAG TPA: thioredoxin domain-containing protein [Pyrinomonadaceae bacterium]|nr:thioredoxin domain-containing protein [Pyrinomonadaceae bacterium]
MDTGEIITLKTPITERDHVTGGAHAPVTLLEYGNFECVDCGIAYPILKHIRKELGDDLRFVFRNFPSTRSNPNALRAAEAAEAGAAQGRFWEMHDELFEHQNGLDDSHLKHYAGLAHLDVSRFEQDMEQHSFLKQIEADYQSSLFVEHITGTPTFYINNLQYTGNIEVESILQVIKDADKEGKISSLKEHSRFRDLISRFKLKDR